MKLKKSIIILFLAGFLSIQAQAIMDEIPPRKYNIRINALPALIGLFHGDFVYSPSKRLSLGLSTIFISRSSENTSASGLGYGPRVNVHIYGKAIGDSLFVGALAHRLTLTLNQKEGQTSYDASVNALLYGALLGYQWLSNSGLNLTISAGILNGNAPSTLKSNPITITNPIASGLLPFFEVALGLAFRQKDEN